MRLSSLSLVAVLLLSTFAFSQHHDTPAPAPPPPPPAAAPSSTPSPAPTFTPSPAPSAPSAPPASHESSSPAPSPTPSHVTMPSAPAPAHISEPSPAPHAPEAGRVVPDQKITGEQKVESAPRVGEDLRAREPIEKNTGDKAKSEPDLRRHGCWGKDCEKPEPKPVESDNDLRRRPCIKEPCPCPPGQKTPSGGCVTTAVQNQCPLGQIWNGGSCVSNGDECLATLGSATHLINQLRTLKAQKDDACARDPGGSECLDLTQQHAVLVAQYRAIFDRSPMACRGRLPDPDTL